MISASLAGVYGLDVNSAATGSNIAVVNNAIDTKRIKEAILIGLKYADGKIAGITNNGEVALGVGANAALTYNGNGDIIIAGALQSEFQFGGGVTVGGTSKTYSKGDRVDGFFVQMCGNGSVGISGSYSAGTNGSNKSVYTTLDFGIGPKASGGVNVQTGYQSTFNGKDLVLKVLE